MRIPVQIVRRKDKDGNEQTYGTVTAFISCPNPRFVYRNIQFMIDTGATMQCCITEGDMALFGVNFLRGGVRLLPEDKWPSGFGGPIRTYAIQNVSFLCKSGDDGKEGLYRVNIPQVQITEGTPPALPSILGSGFLLANRLRLVFSPSEDGVSYLEQV